MRARLPASFSTSGAATEGITFRSRRRSFYRGWFEHDANADVSMADRLTREHLEIRTTVRRIEQGGVRLDALCELGDLLTRHVRFEERELFARIEAGLDPAALAALGDEIAAAESHTS